MKTKTIIIKITVPEVFLWSKKLIIVVLLSLIAGAGLWTRAAFVEPLVGPASSDQDFVQNILGSNDANNDFNSSSVTSNADGSIIERLEKLQSDISTSCP